MTAENDALTEELLYLYGVVPGDARVPPSAERGLEAGRVRLLDLGQVSAVISRVESDEYGEERLNERLRDLEWVGARGMEHEEVLQGLAAETTVLPLRPFSLHAGEARLRDRLEPEVPRLLETLERLRGRGEWSLRMWRDAGRLREALGRHSSRIARMEAEVKEASPGRRFLLVKKLETEIAEEVRTVTGQAVKKVFTDLGEAAEGAVALPVPPLDAGRSEGRELVLRAAFLVHGENADTFRERATALEQQWKSGELSLELTGPWPAYNFSAPDDEQ